MKKIVFIIGSGRKNSFNKTLSQVAAKELEGEAEIEVVDVLDVPLLNQDEEFPAPEGVQKVRDVVMAADGVWLFTPEYNYSIPGTVKNILDWLSRPLTSDYEKKSETAIAGKVVTASGVGGRNKVAGSLAVVKQQFLALRTKPVEPFNGFSLPVTAWTEGTWEPEPEVHEAIAQQAEDFLAAL